MSDTARRLAEEAGEKDRRQWYVDYNCEPEIALNAFERGFLAGWDAAIEHAAQVIDGWHLGDRGSKAQYERLERIAAAIRAERSDR